MRAVLVGCSSLLHLFRHDLSALALITLLPPLAVVTLDPLCCAWLSSFFEPHRRPSARVRRLTWSACRRCCCCESIQLSPVSHGGRAFAKPHRRAAAALCGRGELFWASFAGRLLRAASSRVLLAHLCPQSQLQLLPGTLRSISPLGDEARSARLDLWLDLLVDRTQPRVEPLSSTRPEAYQSCPGSF